MARSEKKGGLPPRRSHRITLAKAARLTARHRNNAPSAEKSGFFHLKPVLDLLSQPGCHGLRYYHGLDAKGGYRIVLVATDANGDDLLAVPARGDDDRYDRTRGTAATQLSRSADAAPIKPALLLEDHWGCPPVCPKASPLNTD